jgi:hypothetical protein
MVFPEAILIINNNDRTIVDQELRDRVPILKSLNVQNRWDFDLINK